jgi:hypothetical protein
MPVINHDGSTAAFARLLVVELISVAMRAGFWLPRRFGEWAFRSVAATVFLMYAVWLVDQPSAAAPGFVIIGLLCLRYVIDGKFLNAMPARYLDTQVATDMRFDQD